MFINMTSAFNADFECLAHSTDMFEFKYLPSSSSGHFLSALSESSSILFLHFPGLLLCTSVFYTAINPCFATV